MKQPNILFFFPDQHRGDWLPYPERVFSKMGRDKLPLEMPNLKRLMKNGVTFTRTVTSSPLCAPARACLASGLRYDKCQVPGNGTNYPLEQKTFYSVLKENGYQVGGVGKFDLNKPEPIWDEKWHEKLKQLGFTDAIDNAGKCDAVNSYYDEEHPDDPYIQYLKEKDLAEIHINDMEDRRERLVYKPTELPEEAYCDNWLSKNGLEMIDDFPVNNPWFLQVNFTGPHDPWDVTQEMRERWQDIDFPVPVEWSEEDKVEEIKKVRQNYAAMLENIDRNIGLYLDKLEERGELDNTIIIYSADHGEMLGDFNKWGKSSPQKGSVRVPLVISGPEIKDITENLYTDSLVELQDLTATILDYCGLEMPEAKDSTSLRPVLSGARKEHRKYQISELKNRKRNWKLVADNRYKLINYQDKKKNQLFDLETDPEQNNPIEDESVEKKMIAHLKGLMKESDSPEEQYQRLDL